MNLNDIRNGIIFICDGRLYEMKDGFIYTTGNNNVYNPTHFWGKSIEIIRQSEFKVGDIVSTKGELDALPTDAAVVYVGTLTFLHNSIHQKLPNGRWRGIDSLALDSNALTGKRQVIWLPLADTS